MAMIIYRLISCFASFVCFLLLVVAHCSHSWRTYQPLSGYYTLGLWTVCSDRIGCQKLYGAYASLELTRIFMLIALVASFMAVVWAIEWDHLFHCNFTFLPKALITSICNFIAGTSLLIGLMMFEIESARIPNKKASFKNWAFYLSCAVGILCLCTVKMDIIRSFMIIALFTSVIAILCSTKWYYLDKYFPHQGLIAAVFNIITGIFVLTSLVLFDVSIHDSTPFEKIKSPKQWSFYTSCIICILCFLTGIYDWIIYKLSLWGVPRPASEVSPEPES